MKKMFKRVVSVMLAAMMMPVIALAQNDQMLQPLPTDPAVRIGKLDNGRLLHRPERRFGS